ncbi:phosphotransferase family protein [Kineosporia sp. J2-2]|uniref:Phosphotransferase family protein n=1 Tax=Kineosporia corallincola TaxID=2835133 RepID=A0ABS5TKE4_9ACTN|nr:phosphotransferase family protein [Kineosporia corallincola]MBT0771567.1 phosphotransferase family protein [Kineosporia corallincola]
MDDESTLARPDLVGPLLVRVTGDERWRHPRAEMVVGGRSNLTYLLTGPAGELVLRRPPSGGVLATAHDMARETRVQRALAGSVVPVPRIVLHDEGDLIGVPFYVMTKLPGLVVRDTLPPGFTPRRCRELGEALTDTLADLHGVDPAAVGLENFGRAEGFAERQVRRWSRQIAATPAKPVPGLDVLADRLLARLPAPQPGTIVHGDYRLDNCLVHDADGPGTVRLSGVLDWEMSTLGDPLTDLGMLLFYWEALARLGSPLARTVTTSPGFPGAEEVARRWSARTGIGIGDLEWYLAFAHFKFAAIALGVQARVEAGAMGGQTVDDLGDLVAGLAGAGLTIVR